MNLPIINGPSEGMLIGVALTYANLWTGPDFWWTPHADLLDTEPGRAIIFASISAIALTLVQQCVHVVRTVQRSGSTTAASALWDLSGFVLMAAGAALWLGSTSEG